MILSISISSSRSVRATVKVEDIVKSVTSASISKFSGIVTPLSSASFVVSSSRSRLSFSPGIPNPTTILRLPSEITFPLSIVTLLKVSFGRIIPVIMINGV